MLLAQSIAHVDLLNNTEDGDGNMKFKGFAIIPAIVTMYDYNENIDIKAQKMVEANYFIQPIMWKQWQ